MLLVRPSFAFIYLNKMTMLDSKNDQTVFLQYFD